MRRSNYTNTDREEMDQQFSHPSYQTIFGLEYIPTDVKLLRELDFMIENTFRKNRDPELYSNSLNISLKMLNRLTLLYFKETVYQRLQNRIHKEIVHLLKHTTLTINQITHELNICDQAYLCRDFKKRMGLSPRAFRKQFQVLALL